MMQVDEFDVYALASAAMSSSPSLFFLTTFALALSKKFRKGESKRKIEIFSI